MTISAHGLARRSVGPAGLWVCGVSASAPMVVLAGGITATYATGVTGVPLSFLLLGGAVGLAMVGMTAMVRDTRPHAATLAALLTHGLGRVVGTAGAAVTVLSYTCIQISLYGLLGATAAPLLGGPWWVWALAACAASTLAGVAHLHTGVRLMGVVLAGELVVLAGLTATAFASPADPATIWDPIELDRLITPGGGTALALGIAAFIGAESVAAFGEETGSRTGIARAVTAVLTTLSLLYFVISWALAAAVGPDVVDDSRALGAELPISLLRDRFGEVAAGAGWALIVVSILGAILAFHHVTSRYLYALGREGVLSTRLATIRHARRTGRGGIPVIGSFVQSALVTAVIVMSAVLGIDPTAVFVLLSTLAALGVMTVLVATAIAAVAHYHRVAPDDRVTPWQRRWAPLLGAAAMTAVLVLTGAGLDPATRWLLPAVIATAAAGGALRAVWLRRHRPAIWAGIGNGQPPPLAVIDQQLSHLDL